MRLFGPARSHPVRRRPSRPPPAELGHRRPLLRTQRVAVPGRAPPESRLPKPKAWMLLAVVAAGVASFMLTFPAVGSSVSGLTALATEAQAVFAAAPLSPATGEQLVPRPAGQEAAVAEVPALVGMEQSEARERAATAGFMITVEEVSSEVVPLGLVVAQDPAPGGQHPREQPIQVTVSLGRPRAAVPNLVGLPAAEARATLETRGFQVVELSAFNQDVPAGVVLRQEPLAGTIADRRSVVALHVSRGIETVTVPPLVGRTEDDARRAIELVGLVVGAITYREAGTVPNGIVETQLPLAGASAPKGAEVEIVVVRVGEATVPDLTGLALAAAERELFDRGLLVGAMTRIPTAGYAEDTVVGQEPGPGAKVRRGFGLRLIVAIPGAEPEPTTPPAEPPSG